MKGGDFPHLLFYGPSGSGKKTRIQCLLREIFGAAAVDKQRLEQQMIVTPSRKKIEVRTIGSNVHIEVNPSDVGNDDRVVMQHLIQSHASSSSLGLDQKVNIKVVIIQEADKLTREAQQSLRRTMEKYMSSCRLILVAEQISRIIPAVRSRCLPVRCPSPTIEIISNILCNIADKEGKEMSESTASKIARASDRNLRRAIMMAETMIMSKAETAVLPHWQHFIMKLAKKIMEKQTPLGLDEVRTDLFQLMAHMISTDMIFEHLVRNLMAITPDKVRPALIDLAAEYESRSRISNKGIIHVEAFVCQFMCACKDQTAAK